MSSAADLHPVARRTLPVVTEAELLAAARDARLRDAAVASFTARIIGADGDAGLTADARLRAAAVGSFARLREDLTPLSPPIRPRDVCGARPVARHHGPPVADERPQPDADDALDRAPWPSDADAPAADEPFARGRSAEPAAPAAEPAPDPAAPAAAPAEGSLDLRRSSTEAPAPITFDVAPAARVARAMTSRVPVARGGTPLDEVLSGAWAALSALEPAPCPICGGAMRPRFGSGAKVESARCGDCSTVLR